MSDINVDKTVSEAERKAKQLPDPVGFKLLCMVPKVEEEFGVAVDLPQDQKYEKVGDFVDALVKFIPVQDKAS